MSLPTFSFSTTADEVATAFASEIQGKNVLVTGTSMNGLGFETARVIAKHASLVIITGYSLERLKLSEEALKKDVPTANIRCLVLDLSSLAAVRKAAAEVNVYPEGLHVLIHNAAAPWGPFKPTVDNLENQMATDHVGPFLLTKLLAPKLLASGTAGYVPRVVILTSQFHALGTGVDFDAIGHPDPEKYVSTEAYAQAKSANCLMAIELSKRSQGKINAYSVHPGTIYTNILQKEESRLDMQAFEILGPDGKPNTKPLTGPMAGEAQKLEWKTIPQGAATTVVAAFDTRLNDKPGAYLSDGVEANKDRAAHSSDPVNAEKLWTATEEIIGEKFTF